MSVNQLIIITVLRQKAAQKHTKCESKEKLYKNEQEAQLLLGDRATRKHAKDS